MKTTATKQEKVLAALQNGEELTEKQIRSRYNVGNVRATVSALRMKGFPIYLNKRSSVFEGVKTTYSKYRIGTPSRAVVAAGYRALASA
tara:strand:+ start:734 stop:1000 length:267 start_codon:yes stop_codon:yes gene_type:complete